MITGGAGFIGSNLVKYFVEKYPDATILVVDKLTYAADYDAIKDLNINFVQADIVDYDTIRDLVWNWKIDTIIQRNLNV